jgi:hypothetical protein
MASINALVKPYGLTVNDIEHVFVRSSNELREQQLDESMLSQVFMDNLESLGFSGKTAQRISEYYVFDYFEAKRRTSDQIARRILNEDTDIDLIIQEEMKLEEEREEELDEEEALTLVEDEGMTSGEINATLGMSKLRPKPVLVTMYGDK